MSDNNAAREREWSDWMRAAQGGDQVAYACLLRAVLPYVRLIVRRRTSALAGNGETEDVVQEVLLSLHLVRHTYDPSRPFRPWLNGIIRHRLLDHIRRRARRGRHEVAVESLPDTSMARAAKATQDTCDEVAALYRAMIVLTPSQRQAFELLKLQGLSLKEASAKTGVSVAALKVAAHRAYKRLRLVLGRHEA